MISITELLYPECMIMELSAKKKKKALREMADLFAAAGKAANTSTLYKYLLKREELASTGIGHGLAIPHTLCDLTEKTVIGFGRSSTGIPFGSADNKPVYMIFLIVGPADATTEHLKILSKLSRLLTDEAFRESLMKASSPQEIVGIFRKGEKEK